MEELDNSTFQGRLLHILPAKHRETSDKQVSVAWSFLSFGLQTCNIFCDPETNMAHFFQQE